MPTIKKSIEIDAPVEQVFDYVMNPENLPHIWPSMVEVKNVRGANGNREYDWLYKMGGMKFNGHSKTIQSRPNEYAEVRNDGIPSTFKWTFQRMDRRTRLQVETEYTLPATLLAKLTEPVLVKMNEREADTLLANLKNVMESGFQPRPESGAHPQHGRAG